MRMFQKFYSPPSTVFSSSVGSLFAPVLSKSWGTALVFPGDSYGADPQHAERNYKNIFYSNK